MGILIKMPDRFHFCYMEVIYLKAKIMNDLHKRSKPCLMDELKITVAKKNIFYDWLKQNNKLGGQNKVPRLSNDRKIIDELLKIN